MYAHLRYFAIHLHMVQTKLNSVWPKFLIATWLKVTTFVCNLKYLLSLITSHNYGPIHQTHFTLGWPGLKCLQFCTPDPRASEQLILDWIDYLLKICSEKCSTLSPPTSTVYILAMNMADLYFFIQSCGAWSH